MIVTTRSATGLSTEQLVSRTLARLRRDLPTGFAIAEPVDAYVNHGRWIVDCPFCRGAEMGDPADPRFLCMSCFNEAVGGLWLAVSFPEKRAEIEAILLSRAVPENRNWQPGETLEDLIAEEVNS